MDGDLFSEIFLRYQGVAQRIARRWGASQADAEDLSSEAFARILSALISGAGPKDEFAPYLARTIRNLATENARKSRRWVPTDCFEGLVKPDDSAEGVAIRTAEWEMLTASFRELPERFRIILWRTAVCGESASEVAQELEITASNVNTLAHRARTRLRRKYIEARLPPSQNLPEKCRAVQRKLVVHMAEKTRKSDISATEEHVGMCRNCGDIAERFDAFYY
ncbi:MULTISPECIES: RNA polymerase sigma factor [unclassified Streptomyces]|uniref:Sigma-70 family RNA polymerase sigma factor n=1 Tax=Streptomyces sp. NBC_00060 TaxID=2975636 RepID=A0AAU2GR75_9ACTN